MFRAILAAFALCLWAVIATAQSGDIDYQAWGSAAKRAEATLEAGSASSRAMEALRADLAMFRQQFIVERDANSSRIKTLQSQLDALGPVPEDGTGAPEITARRAELTDQLTKLRAPGISAQEAYNRADGLIREIDLKIRERQASRLTELGPSPLNPKNWAPALTHLNIGIRNLRSEWGTAWRSATERAQFKDQLPLVLFFLALAGVLLLRGRHWAERIGNWLRGFGGRGTGVWTFVVSLGRIILPLLGLLALTRALHATGLLGARNTMLVDALPIWGGVLLGYRWLAERLFSRNDDDAIYPITPDRRAEARSYMTLLALMMILRSAVDMLSGLENFSSATRSVLMFPLVVVSGLILFRLGQILVTYVGAPVEGETRSSSRVLRVLGRLTMVAAVLSPIMVGIGYGSAGNALLYPTVQSLGLLGLLVVLQRLIGDVYGLFSGQGKDARDALIPILIGFVATFLSIPVLALIWGARVSDLTELWARFREGFAVGDTRISPTDFLTFALVFAVGYVLTRLVQNALRSNVLPKTKIDPGGQNAIVSGLGYVGIFLAALIAVTSAGIDLSSLAIVAGALSLGIGFGLQNIVSNFVSGIILLIERPIAEGDWIEVGGQMGIVRDISVRSTRIETFDRTDVIVPNADLVSGVVTNWTRGNTIGRVIVPVGVAYGNDTRRIEDILRELAEAHPMILTDPAPNVVFQGFGASSLDFEIRGILRDVNWVMTVKSDLNHAIADRFAKEGIEIPFAQTDLWLRNPETLRGRPGGKTS